MEEIITEQGVNKLNKSSTSTENQDIAFTKKSCRKKATKILDYRTLKDKPQEIIPDVLDTCFEDFKKLKEIDEEVKAFLRFSHKLYKGILVDYLKDKIEKVYDDNSIDGYELMRYGLYLLSLIENEIENPHNIFSYSDFLNKKNIETLSKTNLDRLKSKELIEENIENITIDLDVYFLTLEILHKLNLYIDADYSRKHHVEELKNFILTQLNILENEFFSKISTESDINELLRLGKRETLFFKGRVNTSFSHLKYVENIDNNGNKLPVEKIIGNFYDIFHNQFLGYTQMIESDFGKKGQKDKNVGIFCKQQSIGNLAYTGMLLLRKLKEYHEEENFSDQKIFVEILKNIELIFNNNFTKKNFLKFKKLEEFKNFSRKAKGNESIKVYQYENLFKNNFLNRFFKELGKKEQDLELKEMNYLEAKVNNYKGNEQELVKKLLVKKIKDGEELLEIIEIENLYHSILFSDNIEFNLIKAIFDLLKIDKNSKIKLNYRNEYYKIKILEILILKLSGKSETEEVQNLLKEFERFLEGKMKDNILSVSYLNLYFTLAQYYSDMALKGINVDQFKTKKNLYKALRELLKQEYGEKLVKEKCKLYIEKFIELEDKLDNYIEKEYGKGLLKNKYELIGRELIKEQNLDENFRKDINKLLEIKQEIDGLKPEIKSNIKKIVEITKAMGKSFGFFKKSLKKYFIFVQFKGITDEIRYSKGDLIGTNYQLENFYNNVGKLRLLSTLENTYNPDQSKITHENLVVVGQNAVNEYNQTELSIKKDALGREIDALNIKIQKGEFFDEDTLLRTLNTLFEKNIFLGIKVQLFNEGNKHIIECHDDETLATKTEHIGTEEEPSKYSIQFDYQKLNEKHFQQLIKGHVDFIKEKTKLVTNSLNEKIIHKTTQFGTQNKLKSDINKIINNSNVLQTTYSQVELTYLPKIRELYGDDEYKKVLKQVSDLIKDTLGDKQCDNMYVLEDGYNLGFLCSDETCIEKLKNIDFAYNIGNKPYHLTLDGIWSCNNKIEKNIISNSYKNISKLKLVLGELENVDFLEVYSAYNKLKLTDKISSNYQGIVECVDGVWRLKKLESLVRVFDKEIKIYPDQLLPVLEESGKLRDLTKKVINTTFKESKRNLDYSFSINLTKYDLLCGELLEYIDSKIQDYSVNTDNITFELLESKWGNNEQEENKILNFIKKLKDKGFKIALDDYGSSSSNTDRLNKLLAKRVLDYIKIDQTTVVNLYKAKDSKAHLGAIIDIDQIVKKAKLYEIKTIAEYIETQEVANILEELGVNQLQGYYFSQPTREIKDVLSSVEGANFVNVLLKQGVNKFGEYNFGNNSVRDVDLISFVLENIQFTQVEKNTFMEFIQVDKIKSKTRKEDEELSNKYEGILKNIKQILGEKDFSINKMWSFIGVLKGIDSVEIFENKDELFELLSENSNIDLFKGFNPGENNQKVKEILNKINIKEKIEERNIDNSKDKEVEEIIKEEKQVSFPKNIDKKNILNKQNIFAKIKKIFSKKIKKIITQK